MTSSRRVEFRFYAAFELWTIEIFITQAGIYCLYWELKMGDDGRWAELSKSLDLQEISLWTDIYCLNVGNDFNVLKLM